MTTFLLKTDGKRYLNGAPLRPTSPNEWEGAVVNAAMPTRLRGGKAGDIKPSDDLIVWTHEDPAYGSGQGLTATAVVGSVTTEGKTYDIELRNVQLVQPHIRLNDQPSGVSSGSELLDSLKSNRHRRTIEVDAPDVSDFWSAIARINSDRKLRISAFELRRTREQVALESDASQIADGFERRFRLIESRPRQGQFRTELIRVYGRRCLVTSTSVLAVLEAAHIVPFSQGVEFRDDVGNGLLLRSDIHALFDSFLLAIKPDDSSIVIASELKGTGYKRFEGKKVPHKAKSEFLIRQFEEFRRRTS